MKDPIKSQSDDPIRIPYFDWDKAKYFYFVVKLGGVTNAAKFLNIAQSAVSKKIQDLEDRLKCKLLIRTPTGIKITRKGDELFEILERTFLDFKGFAYNNSVMTNKGRKRKIRLSTTHPIAAYVLNEPLLSYIQENSDVFFEIIADDQHLDVVINDVDIAIRPFDIEGKGLEQEPLFGLEKQLFASARYLDKFGEPKCINDLNNHHFVSYTLPEKHPYSDIFWSLKLGMPPNEMRQPVFTSNVIECLVKAAQQGVGIFGGFEKMSIIKDSGLIKVLPNVSDKVAQWYFTYPKSFKNDNQINNIKRFLIEKLK